VIDRRMLLGRARAIAVELFIDGALCVPAYCLVTFVQAIDGRGLSASLSLGIPILGSAGYFALVTLAVRAVTHTPWHFWLPAPARRRRSIRPSVSAKTA